MLRAYTTVIRDSFRAAMNSRVLYIVLALILLVLLVIAPFHVKQSLDWRLSMDGGGVPAPERLVQRLIEEGKSGARPAVAHIWSKLPAEIQGELEQESKRDTERSRGQEGPGGSRVVRRLVKELNTLMDQSNLYDEEAFKGKRLSEEAKSLLEKDASRSVAEDRRLNRLLLSTALRRDIAAPGQTQLDFYYFKWHWSFLTASISHSAFASSITSQLPTFFDKFVMSIGIFIAILITASIVPEMLEAGSLNLLLSKPVHRWGLLLAKYIGGCVFILLCASLLFIGVWLWMGIQLGIWERAILLSIPTYVFVFAMYYSISVLAGIWFRSPVLCITFAILFWAICSAVGYGYAWLDYRHYNTSARQIAATGDNVVTVDMLMKTQYWDQSDNEWRDPSSRTVSPDEFGFVFASFLDRLDENNPGVPGPLVDNQGRVLFTDAGFIDLVTKSTLNIASTDPNRDWKIASHGSLLPSTQQVLFSEKLGQLSVDQSGSIYQWKGKEVEAGAENKKEVDDNEKENASNPANGISKQIGGFLKGRKDRPKYDNISTESASYSIQTPSAICLNATNDDVVFYGGDELVVMQAVDGKYESKLSRRIGDHENKKMTAFVSAQGDFVFVMLGNGRFYHLDSNDLSELNSVNLGDRAAVRSLAASPDGRFVALTTRGGELWIYDTRSKSEYSGFAIETNDIMACTFDEQNRLWIGDRFQEARCYDLESGKELLARKHDGGWVMKTFRYAIRPLYQVFPKPGEFYKLVSHLSSSGDARDNPDIDLTRLPHRDDPWSPLRSGIIFTAMVLIFSCILFQRQDF